MDIIDFPNSLIQKLKAGDPSAASEVFNRFASRLVALARVRLDARVRRKVDAEDIVQSVFRSFFARSAKGEFEFNDWGGMWGLLVLLTIRKCGRRVKHFGAAQRDIRRERHDDGDSERSVRWCEGIADEPSPDEAAELADITEKLFELLDSDRDRRILELSLQSQSVQEISVLTGHYERGVERVREDPGFA